MLYLLSLSFMLFGFVHGGSQCRPRSGIYPCICIDRRIGKSKLDTTVVCRGLDDGASLKIIEGNLKLMEMNKFLLYDSYWMKDTQDDRRLQNDENVPINILSSYRIEEIQVVDSNMQTFGCPVEYNCGTNYLKKFTMINSTIPERKTCRGNPINLLFFISCPEHLEYIYLERSFASETTLKPDFFPMPMPRLKSLHMPRNRISKLDKRTFTLAKFPSLQLLDLSYNLIKDHKLFSSMLKVKVLDLSHNALRALPEIQFLPHLQSLKLANNQIVALMESDWQFLPERLRFIDLLNNDINCGCDMTFVNSTFHVSNQILGNCKEGPERVKGMKLRRASRFLIEHCKSSGEIKKQN